MTENNIIIIIGSNKMNNFVIKHSLGNEYILLSEDSYDDAKNKIDGIYEKICAVFCCDYALNNETISFVKDFQNDGYSETIPLIMIIPKEQAELNARKCYSIGFCEIIELPFDPFYFKAKIDAIKRLYSHSSKKADALQKSKDSSDVVINILSTVFEFIQFEPPAHITRVKGLTSLLATTLADAFPQYNLDDDVIKYISKASAIHDIGKAKISPNILFKAGKLTNEEFDIMRTHTVKGAEVLEEFGLDNSHPFYKHAFDICKYHHERWDGKGYPFHLENNQIPISAQIVSIVDVYDSMISDKVYKAAIPYEKALFMIRDGQCGIFPPDIIESFNLCEEKFRSYLEESLNVKIVHETK